MSIINFPLMYIPDPDKGKPLFNAQIFVGEPDLDPTVVINQKQLRVALEDGSTVDVAQPFLTSNGGVPTYNGEAVRLDVDGNYAIKILSKTGAQKYYIENVYEGQPITSEEFKDRVIPFATIAEAIASTDPLKIFDDAVLQIADRANSTWDVVLASGVTPNTYDIVQSVGLGSLALVLRVGAILNIDSLGALGDNSNDDTEYFNHASNLLTTLGGTLQCTPNKIYKINTDGPTTGIRLKSNIIFDLNGAALSAISIDTVDYRLIWIQEDSNITVKNGKVIGDLDTNTNTVGEQGHCIYVILDCDNILIENVNCTKAFGDGVYLGRECSNLRVINSTLTYNRRNNISVITPSNVVISGCEISHAAGVSPEAGIDVEPNPTDNLASGILISHCFIHNNNQEGIGFPAPSPTALIDYATIDNCHIYDNVKNGIVYGYVRKLQISNCAIYGNGLAGIQENQTYTESTIISNNIIRDNATDGINAFTSNSTITGNQFIDSGGYGVVWENGSTVNISNNVVRGCVEDGIKLTKVNRSVISGNTISDIQKHGISLIGLVTSTATHVSKLDISGNVIYNAGLLTDDTYDGINGNQYVDDCSINSNTITAATSGNQNRNAININSSSIVAVGNITKSGCKSSNSQIVLGSVSLPSFTNNPNHLGDAVSSRLWVGGTAASILSGAGSPEGAQSAMMGSLYLNTSGGASTTLYVKESGASSTGWVAK